MRCSPSHRSAGTRRQANPAGFTMIEMIGVLAVIALLASVVLTNVLESIKQAARDAEGQNLANLAGAIQTSALRTLSLPGPATWIPTLTDELSLPSNTVACTRYGVPRMVLFDPTAVVGTNTSQTFPYVQTQVGSVRPVNVRVILMSSLGDALPTPPTNGFALAWATPAGSVPSYFPSSWSSKLADFKMQRLDLGPLFNHVILENQDFRNPAPYSVNSTNTLTTVPPGGRREVWFLDNTPLNFHFADNSLQAREYIVDDASYTFENGRWGRYLKYGSNLATGPFGAMVDQFLNARPIAAPKFYANQQAIIDTFFNYLFYYGLWAQRGFPSGNPMPQVPEYGMSYDAQVEMGNFTYNWVN